MAATQVYNKVFIDNFLKENLGENPELVKELGEKALSRLERKSGIDAAGNLVLRDDLHISINATSLSLVTAYLFLKLFENQLVERLPEKKDFSPPDDFSTSLEIYEENAYPASAESGMIASVYGEKAGRCINALEDPPVKAANEVTLLRIDLFTLQGILAYTEQGRDAEVFFEEARSLGGEAAADNLRLLAHPAHGAEHLSAPSFTKDFVARWLAKDPSDEDLMMFIEKLDGLINQIPPVGLQDESLGVLLDENTYISVAGYFSMRVAEKKLAEDRIRPDVSYTSSIKSYDKNRFETKESPIEAYLKQAIQCLEESTATTRTCHIGDIENLAEAHNLLGVYYWTEAQGEDPVPHFKKAKELGSEAAATNLGTLENLQQPEQIEQTATTENQTYPRIAGDRRTSTPGRSETSSVAALVAIGRKAVNSQFAQKVLSRIPPPVAKATSKVWREAGPMVSAKTTSAATSVRTSIGRRLSGAGQHPKR